MQCIQDTGFITHSQGSRPSVPHGANFYVSNYDHTRFTVSIMKDNDILYTSTVSVFSLLKYTRPHLVATLQGIGA